MGMGTRLGDPAVSATFTVSFATLDDLESRMNPGKVLDRIEGEVEESTEKGRQVMREAIETRGTGKTWKTPWFGRSGSFPGRVDQGDMLKDVKGEVTQRTKRAVTGMVGWDENSPLYYRLQDNGFRHVLTGEDVEGMMALRDASEVAKRALISGVEDIARSI